MEITTKELYYYNKQKFVKRSSKHSLKARSIAEYWITKVQNQSLACSRRRLLFITNQSSQRKKDSHEEQKMKRINRLHQLDKIVHKRAANSQANRMRIDIPDIRATQHARFETKLYLVLLPNSLPHRNVYWRHKNFEAQLQLFERK